MREMENKIEVIAQKAREAISGALSLEDLKQLRSRFIGRKGELTTILRSLNEVPKEMRPRVGQLANRVKIELASIIEEKQVDFITRRSAVEAGVRGEDLSLPGRGRWKSAVHPITRMFDEIGEIFFSMGFSVERGPEIEEEYYNFTALNFPPDHPALDMQATFFMDDGLVLRTHTSPVQIRTFLKEKPPVRVIAPGRCYRSDKIDASHYPVFHQVEGFFVDTGVTFADLKATLIEFSRKMFGDDVQARFRPSYFPFTEPSAEVDIACLFCRGAGCKVCKGTGWLEILGSGMIDPAVFEAVDYDPEKFTGFAFGMGVERIAMLKYGIGDIRFFYENDVKFLEQFI